MSRRRIKLPDLASMPRRILAEAWHGVTRIAVTRNPATNAWYPIYAA
jgi:hypothetical protein